jgi:hypothetical protein
MTNNISKTQEWHLLRAYDSPVVRCPVQSGRPLERKGLVERNGSRIRLTPAGRVKAERLLLTTWADSQFTSCPSNNAGRFYRANKG